jgi:hypothetical protein
MVEQPGGLNEQTVNGQPEETMSGNTWGAMNGSSTMSRHTVSMQLNGTMVKQHVYHNTDGNLR